MPEVVRASVEAAVGDAKLWLIAPEAILFTAGLVAMMLGAFLGRQHGRLVGYLTLVGVVGSLAYLVLVLDEARFESAFSGLFVHDPLARFIKYLILLTTGVVILMSMRYLDEEDIHHGEYYALLCFATLGMMFMASAADLLTIYVGLELMALSIYVLVGFLKRERRSNEAAMKYFLLGAFSSAFLVYGISLLYGVTGVTALDALGAGIGAEIGNPLVVIGVILLSVGLAFKIAAVPFHAWAPDAYEGAPTPITAYVSVASKTAAFAVLLRILLVGLYDLRADWTLILWVLAVASMTYGNVVAVVQDNVKRMLAYSSIAHAGYLLIGVIAAGAAPPREVASGNVSDQLAWALDQQRWAQGGVLIYLFAYAFMNLGTFALVTMLRRRDIIGDQVKDFAGLFQRAPWAAVAMAIFLLSLAGIPPTAGFVGKLVLFAAAIKAQFYWLAVIAVLNTAISAYFYFRIIVQMWMSEARERVPLALSPELKMAVALALLFTLWVGVYPQSFLGLAQGSILPLGGGLPMLSRSVVP